MTPPTANIVGIPGQPGGPKAPNLNAQIPLLLLPVHIQTRFMDLTNGQSELWVRIYPDQIAINSHEPELTAPEIAAGQTYWNAIWQAGNPAADPDALKAPWRLLASLYGAQRAAWIALALTPSNLEQQPAAPTPPGATSVPSPVFPAVAQRDSSWERPAVAGALPDAWTVVLVSGTQSSPFRGSAIASPLAVSLTPNSGAFPAGSQVDAGLQWMVDFDSAVAAGMALKIPLTAQQRAAGFDTIFAYGTPTSDADPANASQTLTDLLNAHHYTDGFSLVPQGAPTNNTPDSSSAYSRKDPNYELSFATERQGPLTMDPACDGNVFTAAAGVLPGTLDHIAWADATDSLNGSDMLQALWPATLGYFLSQMMADVFTPAVIEEARQYVMANALPRGPVPALRVGRTPYGVLPVTSLRNYPARQTRAAAVEPGLVSLVTKLWPTWLQSSASAPHMQRGGDPDQNLMSVLGMDASAMSFQGRPVLGSDFAWNLLGFLGVPQAFQSQWWQSYFLFGRELLSSYGYGTWNPKLLGFAFDVNSFPIGFPTVQTAPLSETDALAADADLGGGTQGNYIQWLATAAVADLQAESYPGVKPTSLLYKILRQSLLFDYSNLAGVSEVAAGTLTLAQIRETEIVSVQPNPATLTPLQVLARPAAPNPQLTWADYLVTTEFAAGSPFSRLSDLRASLGRLAKLPTAELDRLLTETLDACSHRLDVWATAIANSLLKRARAQNDAVNLGGYGWVEDVRPETGRVAVQGAELRQVQSLDASRQQERQVPAPLPVQPLSDNGGYVLAPSQAQAAAAAVLRSGYMTHQQTSEEGLLAIDLSSERVQKALWLIAGVQQGQSLNALLGYLFEDALHDRNLDTYIQPFRDAYPVVGDKLTPASAPSPSVAASNVVDGLALRTAWDAGKLKAGASWGAGLPAPGADQSSVIAILEVLDDYADALGDVSISEAVFQAVRGNFGGAALMDAISRGSRPPLPEIVNTPRGGLDLTHRVAIVIAGAPAPAAAWNGITPHPRAAAEPWLDAWLTGLLPDPATVRCQVQYQDSGGPHTVTLTLRDLDAGPLDLLAMADAAEVPQRSELEARILYAAALPAGAQDPQIVFQATALPPGSISFPDALYLAQKLRTLMGAARPLVPQDMTVPENNAAKAGGVVSVTELAARATAALQSLRNDLQALATAATPDALRAALLACSFYGVPGAIPGTTSGADPNLAAQAASVAAALQTRYNTASGVDLGTARPAALESVFEAIFGGDFVVLPQFTPPDLATLRSAFAQSSSLVSTDPQAPLRWLRQLTHVHPAISRLDMALSTAQALCGGTLYPPTLTLGQVPPPAALPDRWLGLPLDAANPPNKGRVALACLAAGDLTVQNTFAGLLVDEWNERIPVTPVNASLAFHFEEPGARAPQALLLAVCPDDREIWDDDLVQAVLEETLELAKIRTVDLASIERVGQILPALYFALNLQGATISTRFAILKEAIGGTRNVATGTPG